MVNRFLITTALEESWPENNRQVVFLGEWCRLYSRKEYWQKINAEVLAYHWDDRNKLYRDFILISEVYERVLSDLSIALNEIHGVDFSIKYWRILIGVWLLNFIQMFFDRYEMIQKAIFNYGNVETVLLNIKDQDMIPNDIDEFINLFIGDEWNHYLYSFILDRLPNISTIRRDYEILASSEVTHVDKSEKDLKSILSRTYSKLTGLLTKEGDALFFSTFMSKFDQIKLSFEFLQFPVLPYVFKSPKVKPIMDQRKWLLKGESKSDFELLLREIIPYQIPVLYLEGYKELSRVVGKTGWPNKPKVIFTANAYYANEIFKLYTAEKVEKGAPLVIGQHGGHYGVSKWSSYEQLELAICSKYLSWGWESDKVKKVKPVGKITADEVPAKNKKNEQALLVTMATPRYSYTMYSTVVAAQWELYFEDQCSFIHNLNDSIREKLLVRIYKQDYGWNQYDRFKDRFPELSIDKGYGHIKDQINKSKIYISTYNATTFLESMNMDIPTVIFWDENYWEIRDSAIPYYTELKKAGVFHESPESAAKFVNKIWNDIDQWWNNEQVRTLVNKFKTQYCFLPNNLVANVSKELRLAIEDQQSTMNFKTDV